LSALKTSLRIFSPSRETGKLGDFFGQGFTNAIDDSTKEAIKKSKALGQKSTEALSSELGKYKHSFAKISTGIENGKQNLIVEHTLDGRLNELIGAVNNDNSLSQLLQATLEQNKILM